MHIKDPFLKNLLFFTVGYVLVSPLVWWLTGDFLHAFLGWNLILGFIPLIISKFLTNGKSKKGWIILTFSFVWLLFLPNALYVITDLLYLGERDFYIQEGLYDIGEYTQDIVNWVVLIHIFLGALISAVCGAYSLFVMKTFGEQKIGKKWAFATLLAVCGLIGVGIYIGRFFRYNSWDLLSIGKIISDVIANFGWFTVLFILLMAGVQLTIYYLLCPLFDHVITKIQKEEKEK